MIEIAKKQAPLAEFQVADIETITFPLSSFDGAWAGCIFSHTPKKILPQVLRNIHAALKLKGCFYLTVKKGIGEELQKDLRYGNVEKFWSFFDQDEIVGYVETAQFKIIDCCTVEKKFAYQTHPSVRIFCQRN